MHESTNRTPDQDVIRHVIAPDVPIVASVLAEAFYPDPLMRWMIPDDDRRLRALERLFEVTTRRVWLPAGASYLIDERSGAAMWLSPGEWRVGWRTQLRMLPSLLPGLRTGGLSRMNEVDRFIEERHPDERPHWYLNAMGVHPERQGQGLGSALLSHMLKRCDRESLPAYLETSTQGGRALYQRHGFEVVEECRFAVDGPLLWRMWREPRA